MRKFFHMWDFFTLPPPPKKNQLDYKAQMKERQAYFISRLLLLEILACSISIIIILFNPGPHHVLWSTTGALVFCIFLAISNRFGQVTLAGWGLLFTTVGPIMFVVLVHIPFKVTDLPLLCLLTVTEVFAGLLLPAWMIFVVMIFNCLLVILTLYLLPLDPSLKIVLVQQPKGIFFPLLSLLLEIGIGTYILVVCLSKEVHRASYAEKLAQLQAEQAVDRQRLRDGVTVFAAVLAQVGKGILDARVTMSEGDVLWEIAIPLNALLNQAEVWRKRDSQCRQLEQAVTDIVHYLECLQDQPDAAPPPPSGTAADHIIHLIQERLVSDV